MKSAKHIAICSVTTALSVALMFLGGVSYIFAYLVPIMTGLFMIMLKKTFNKSCAVCTYFATSLLCIMLVTDKDCMLMYVMFFGFYPIIHERLDSIKPKPLSVIVKYLIFNVLMVSEQLILLYVFHVPIFEKEAGKYIFIAFMLLLNLLFFCYQIMLKKLEYLYNTRLEKKVKKYFR